MRLERKTIFLYPKANELNKQIYRTTSQLITRIQKIVRISNRLIENILHSGCFSFIKCKPTVDMQCIGQNSDDYSDYSNVRICVAKYDNIDYTHNYSKIVNDMKNDKTDISHLVALHIYTSCHPIRFSSDKNNNFDAIIETDLDHLENLLVAIMLDISLYHYFLLSNDLKFRKNFNNIKFKYIVNNLSGVELKKIYGDDVDVNNPIYLPFSMQRVMHLSKITKQSAKNECIEILIRNYAIFLMISNSKELIIDEYGYISNSDELKTETYFSYLEDFVKKVRNKSMDIYSETILIVSPDSTRPDIHLMIEYKSNKTDISEWLNLLNTDICEYKLIFIKRKKTV